MPPTELFRKSISNKPEVKPTCILRDEMPPIIVRMCAEFAKKLQTYCETNMFQLAGSAWDIQREVFRMLLIRNIRVRAVSGEIDGVSAMVLSEAFQSSPGIDRITVSVSYRSVFPGRPSFWSLFTEINQKHVGLQQRFPYGPDGAVN
jgi:hypothetical protein